MSTQTYLCIVGRGAQARLRTTALAALVAVGCSADTGRGGEPGGVPLGPGTAADSDFDPESPADSNGNSDSVSASGPSGDDPKFDLGSGGGVDPDAPVQLGCHKVDFLFVIDNSTSMEDEQANLIANFGDFIDGIQSTLDEVDDYHVGVTTTDAYGHNLGDCKGMGGLVIKTGGKDSSMTTCGPYAEGNNFMTEQDDLSQAFSCAAQVGTGGWPLENPIDSLRAVLDGGPGTCNTSFLRGDALLVVVLITDEAEGPGDPELLGSPGTPQQWYDEVVAAKGFEDNVAVVSLINYEGGPCPPMEPGFDGKNLLTFTELFPFGAVGGICDDYGPVFAQATDVVDEACKNFIPPG